MNSDIPEGNVPLSLESSPADNSLTTVSEIKEVEEIKSEFGDAAVFRILQNFINADKPAWFTPIDGMLMTVLLTSRAMDHATSHSNTTLAHLCGCDDKTIGLSLLRLRKHRWIRQECRRGRSKLTIVNLNELPTADKRTWGEPTERAHWLVGSYAAALRKKFNVREKHQHWLKAQAFSAQKIIDRCGGDWRLAVDHLSHAFRTERFYKALKKDLYSVWGQWRQIEQSFKEAKAEEAQRATQAGVSL